jgi:hypothetical protein
MPQEVTGGQGVDGDAIRRSGGTSLVAQLLDFGAVLSFVVDGTTITARR